MIESYHNSNKFPIILQEKYAKHPSYYVKKEHNAFSKKMQNDFSYDVLTDVQFKSINIKRITKFEELKIVSARKNIDFIYKKLLEEENKVFEKIIEDKIKEIQIEYEESIEAIVTWIWYPSLEKIAKKYQYSRK